MNAHGKIGSSIPVDPKRLTSIVEQLAHELHPQRVRDEAASFSSRLERDLGIDSLGRTELVLRLERAFGVRLPIGLIAEADTVADLRLALDNATPSGEKPEAVPVGQFLSK